MNSPISAKRTFARPRAPEFLAVMFLSVLVGTSPASPASAAESGTVTATVTSSVACITLDVTTTTFASKPFSTASADEVAVAPGVAITNCGGSAENVLARGTDATGSAGTQGTVSWALNDGSGNVCDLGIDRFKVRNALRDASSQGGELASLFLSTTNKALGPSQAAGETRRLSYDMHMPCSGSSGAGIAMQLQFVYTATF